MSQLTYSITQIDDKLYLVVEGSSTDPIQDALDIHHEAARRGCYQDGPNVANWALFLWLKCAGAQDSGMYVPSTLQQALRDAIARERAA